MKKLILLALTALTLMACADNGVSAPGADEPNNGNCVDVLIGWKDVQEGGAYVDYDMKWQEGACIDWGEAGCRSVDFSKKVIIKECI